MEVKVRLDSKLLDSLAKSYVLLKEKKVGRLEPEGWEAKRLTKILYHAPPLFMTYHTVNYQ